MTMNLTILCEGATERNFVVQTLGPYLRKFKVFAKPIDLGGSQSISSFKKQINNAFHTRRQHECVTTMIDLYGLGGLLDSSKQHNETPEERVRRIETNLFKEFPNLQFIPYIQLHEFEALVFVDVPQITIAFPDEEIDNAIKILIHDVGQTEPEMINDGKETAPSKRIIKAIPYEGVKSSAGPQIVHSIGLKKLMSGCPHFNQWVTRLEKLGSPWNI